MARQIAHPSPGDRGAAQLASWWRDFEVALDAGQMQRARRFLRWILACNPCEEEAWLRMAALVTSDRQRTACLRQAYLFCPNSSRVLAALRQEHDRGLRSGAGELQPRQPLPHCLPNARVSRGGHRQPPAARQEPQVHPLQAMSDMLLWRMRLPAQLLRVDLAAWLAFVLPLAVYLSTACSTVYNLDSAEFSAAVHVLGIVRATGYPLYLLLGKVFEVLLPVGDVGFRLNVMSALCGAATVGLLYRIGLRLARNRAAALAAALLFGFSYYFWAQAVVAEVYTLHTLFLGGLLLILLRWEQERSDTLLPALGLVYGLSLGNHMSSVLIGPGLVAFLLAVAGKEMLAPRRLLLLIGPFVAGLGVYLYLPLRYLADPAFNYAGHFDATGQFVPLDLTNPANIWWLVSGQGFRELMFGYTPGEILGELGGTAHRLWATFLGVGLLPGLLGIRVQARRPRHLLLFGLIFAGNLVFYTAYRVVDKAAMFVPAYLVWAIWVAEGCAWLVGWLQAQQRAGSQRPPAWAWGLTVLALVALLVNGPLLNVRDDTRARDRAEAILQAAEPEAIVFGWWTSVPPVQYLQIVEGQRPDVLAINRFLISAAEMYTLIDRSLGRRPVYVVEMDDGLAGAYRAVPVGPMFELEPAHSAGARP